jgi:hypothetical protein
VPISIDSISCISARRCRPHLWCRDPSPSSVRIVLSMRRRSRFSMCSVRIRRSSSSTSNRRRTERQRIRSSISACAPRRKIHPQAPILCRMADRERRQRGGGARRGVVLIPAGSWRRAQLHGSRRSRQVGIPATAGPVGKVARLLEFNRSDVDASAHIALICLSMNYARFVCEPSRDRHAW